MVLKDAVSLDALAHARAMANRDAADVPIDPHGGLPWAYDVFPEDYSGLTENAVSLMSGATSTKVKRVTLIKKTAGEPRRFWHNDLDEPPTPRVMPSQILALYYLTATNKQNGCLLVRPEFISGPKHEQLDARVRYDEVEVPVELGDVVLMDPRLQHASLANQTTEDRLLVRVWTENTW